MTASATAAAAAAAAGAGSSSTTSSRTAATRSMPAASTAVQKAAMKRCGVSSTTSNSAKVSSVSDALPSIEATASTAQCSSLMQLRRLRDGARERRSFEAALFWADKCCSVDEYRGSCGSNGRDNYEDTLVLASLYLDTAQHARAVLLLAPIVERGQHSVEEKSFLKACRLTAEALIKQEQWDEALALLDSCDLSAVSYTIAEKTVHMDGIWDQNVCMREEALVLFLKGTIYQHQSNFALAKVCFQQALRADVRMVEALDALLTNHLLTSSEEETLFAELFDTNTGNAIAAMMHYLYAQKREAFDDKDSIISATSLPITDMFSTNADVLAHSAARLLDKGRVDEAFALTKNLLASDEFDLRALPHHIACLCEKRLSNEHFLLGHRLVDHYPESALAWFAVGCYYLTVGKHGEARRYFRQATSFDKQFTPAWIGFGHTFAYDGEHDQAIAAYTTAARMFPGNHRPLLFMAIEHVQTHHYVIARELLTSCAEMQDADPMVYNELGVVAYHHEGDFAAAKEYFMNALACATDLGHGDIHLEPILVNLAHACRKLGEWSAALSYFQEAHRMVPGTATTVLALGLVHHAMGNVELAVELYHEALALQPESTLGAELLSRALSTPLLTSSFWNSLPADERDDDAGIMGMATVAEDSVDELLPSGLRGRTSIRINAPSSIITASSTAMAAATRRITRHSSKNSSVTRLSSTNHDDSFAAFVDDHDGAANVPHDDSMDLE